MPFVREKNDRCGGPFFVFVVIASLSISPRTKKRSDTKTEAIGFQQGTRFFFEKANQDHKQKGFKAHKNITQHFNFPNIGTASNNGKTKGARLFSLRWRRDRMGAFEPGDAIKSKKKRNTQRGPAGERQKGPAASAAAGKRGGRNRKNESLPIHDRGKRGLRRSPTAFLEGTRDRAHQRQRRIRKKGEGDPTPLPCHAGRDHRL